MSSPVPIYPPEIAAPVLGALHPDCTASAVPSPPPGQPGAGLSHGETESFGHDQEVPVLDLQL